MTIKHSAFKKLLTATFMSAALSLCTFAQNKASKIKKSERIDTTQTISKDFMQTLFYQKGDVAQQNRLDHNQQKDGRCIVHYPITGKPTRFENGVAHDIRHGHIKQVQHWKNGRAHGQWLSYFNIKIESPTRIAQIQSATNYVDGKLEGIALYFDEFKGKIALEISYENGEKHGPTIYHKKTNNPDAKTFVKDNDLKPGDTKWFLHDNEVTQETYNASLVSSRTPDYLPMPDNGQIVTRTTSGTIHSIHHIDKDRKRHGLEIIMNKNTHAFVVSWYKNDRIHGYRHADVKGTRYLEMFFNGQNVGLNNYLKHAQKEERERVAFVRAQADTKPQSTEDYAPKPASIIQLPLPSPDH